MYSGIKNCVRRPLTRVLPGYERKSVSIELSSDVMKFDVGGERWYNHYCRVAPRETKYPASERRNKEKQ